MLRKENFLLRLIVFNKINKKTHFDFIKKYIKKYIKILKRNNILE